MKRTKKRKFLLMTVLFLLTMGMGSAAAWASVTVPTKAMCYRYNSWTKKWEKYTSFSASYSNDGKLKKVTYYDYRDDNGSMTFKYVWKGDYLKKEIVTYSDDSDKYITTYSYKKNKLMKKKSDQVTTTYKWKGKKGNVGCSNDGIYSEWKVTLKNGRLAREKHNGITDYKYKKGLLKSRTYKSGSRTRTITFARNGFPRKITGSDGTEIYDWKKNEVIIKSESKGGKINNTPGENGY